MPPRTCAVYFHPEKVTQHNAFAPKNLELTPENAEIVRLSEKSVFPSTKMLAYPLTSSQEVTLRTFLTLTPYSMHVSNLTRGYIHTLNASE